MIDADLINEQPRVVRDQIRDAVITLALSGILGAQRKRLLALVAEGADDEEDDDIVRKVLIYRRQSHELLALEQLGESFNVERNNEED